MELSNPIYQLYYYLLNALERERELLTGYIINGDKEDLFSNISSEEEKRLNIPNLNVKSKLGIKTMFKISLSAL